MSKKPTIFTVNLFNKERLKDRDLFITSWENAMSDYNIKIYTEQDEIVQEALKEGSPWINYCKNAKLFNYATNFIRIYILGKLENHLYMDDDVFVYKNILDNIDQSTNYVSFKNETTFDGILSALYNGAGPLKVENTLNYLNNFVLNLKELNVGYIIKHCNDNCVISRLMIDNCFKVFPQDLFFHYNSLWPCIKRPNAIIKNELIDYPNIDKYADMFEPNQVVIFLEDTDIPYSELKISHIDKGITIVGIYKFNNSTINHILYFIKLYYNSQNN